MLKPALVRIPIAAVLVCASFVAAANAQTPRMPPPPPPPRHEQHLPAPPRLVHLSAEQAQGRLLHAPRPVYSSIARAAHVTGAVVLQARINTDGKVENLSVVSGHPLLREGALEGVKQWVYQPLSVNGTPVEFETEITVVFGR